MTYGDALERLASLHVRARVVPVLGAGMSARRCVTWKALVENLEAAAGTQRAGDSDEALVERSHRALTALRRRGADMVEEISRALVHGTDGDHGGALPQTDALAALRWPLVITTNYDDLYVEAARRAHHDPGPQIVGRSPLDSQRVLTALHEPSEPLLWALHGYLGGIAAERPHPLPVPESELVVGHDEYRRVTHTAAHFRRAFSEVLRSRSLLFLGCGLDDPHLVGLLEETLELTGASPMPRFAVVFDEDRSSEREWILRDRLSIEPIVLPRFDGLPTFLRDLRARVVSRRPRVLRWPLHLSCGVAGEPGPASVEVVRGPLPESPDAGACLAVSAGRAGHTGQVRPWFSGRIWAQLNRLGIDASTRWPPIHTASAFRVPETPVIVAFARTEDFALYGRDARLISRTAEAMLGVARAEGFHTVHAQLLASGGGSPFPPRVSLAHMLRGYARWHARTPEGPRLLVHVVDEELLHELDAQRIDLLELLELEAVRFWVEVADGEGRADRELRHERLDLHLGQLAKPYFTIGTDWNATVIPGSTRADESVEVAAGADRTLEELGVLPGATVRFHRGELRSASWRER